MPPTRRDKVTAQAEHLLDVFLGLRAKYAVLEPMLFGRDGLSTWAAGKRAQGFHIIRNTLLMSCVLDVAKIALDKDDRVPSLLRLVDSLGEQDLTEQLREEFAVWHLAPTAGEGPEIIALLQAAERREQAARRAQFDDHVAGLRDGWARLRDSAALKSFATLRDKLIAHSELHHDGNGYRPLDIAGLGLTYDDLRNTIAETQALVQLVGQVFRSASFDFAMLDGQLQTARDAYWSAL